MGYMEFGTERKASSGSGVARGGSHVVWFRRLSQTDGDNSSRRRIRQEGRLGEFGWLKGRPSVEFGRGTIAEEFDR